MPIKWDKTTETKQINWDKEFMEGDDLTVLKEKIASLPDMVPANVTGSIRIFIERKIES